MLHKSLHNSLKDVDAGRGVVCGYASSFNVVDDGNDCVLPGAFTKTIAEQGPGSRQPRIKFLYQHDTTAILGVPQTLKEDGFGLYFEVKIADTTLGRDVLTLYQEGCITEHSIGYETVQAEWDRSHAVRLLKELRLFEFSAVTFGMNPETPTVAVKSLADPSRLTALAEQAQRLDTVLHSGSLRSTALCEALERELKTLHTALAPTRDEASQPYTIQGVLASMNSLADRLADRLNTGAATKAATQADKDAQKKRSEKYGIGIKSGGSVTKPSAYANLSDDDFADPVNYSYPLDTKAHADNAAARFGDPDNRAVYTKAEQAIIDKRIAAAQKKFGEDDKDSSKDSDKGVDMTRRMVKGSGGDVAVSEDGTHAAYTGTHTHSHSAMGEQGSDAMHEHEHTHDGDAAHGHEHAKAQPQQRREWQVVAPNGRQVRKARDFDMIFQSLVAGDQLQDDWGDTFIAFTYAMSDLMWQATAQTNGWVPEGQAPVDIEEAAQANLSAFSKAVMSLVTRSLAADFAPCLDDDGDQFLDPDGVNGDDDGWKARGGRTVQAPERLPDFATLARQSSRKAGRTISSANRETLTGIADGIAEHVKGIMAHHGALTNLLTKTDPDAVRQDEDDVEGDDDTANGGHNINDGYPKSLGAGRQNTSIYTPRRSAATHGQAATTHQQGNDRTTSGTLDMSAIVADLDALKSRLVMAGKA